MSEADQEPDEPAPEAPRRRPWQVERSAATQARLLEATFDCLVELGYAKTSTPEVLRRAGLSRGAMLHHYPTRADLLAAAMDYVFEKRFAEYEEAFAALGDDDDRPVGAIDLLWDQVSSPTYYAWLELVVAARTDEALRDRIRPVNERFDRRVAEIRKRLLPAPATGEDRFYKVAPQFMFATLNGLALSGIYEEPERLQRVIELLKQIARLVQASRAGKAQGP
jgi:AcrR family transcriptional regulator